MSANEGRDLLADKSMPWPPVSGVESAAGLPKEKPPLALEVLLVVLPPKMDDVGGLLSPKIDFVVSDDPFPPLPKIEGEATFSTAEPPKIEGEAVLLADPPKMLVLAELVPPPKMDGEAEEDDDLLPNKLGEAVVDDPVPKSRAVVVVVAVIVVSGVVFSSFVSFWGEGAVSAILVALRFSTLEPSVSIAFGANDGSSRAF